MSVTINKKKVIKKSEKKENNKSFLSLAGLYKTEKLNLKDIRKQAWR